MSDKIEGFVAALEVALRDFANDGRGQRIFAAGAARGISLRLRALSVDLAPEFASEGADAEVAELASLREQKDNAYRERDLCVALIAKLVDDDDQGNAWLGRHDPNDKEWDDDWRNIVFVELPTGQMSWHIHDSEMPLFKFLRTRKHPKWDGHTTEEKYKRLRAALKARAGKRDR